MYRAGGYDYARLKGIQTGIMHGMRPIVYLLTILLVCAAPEA